MISATISLIAAWSTHYIVPILPRWLAAMR